MSPWLWAIAGCGTALITATVGDLVSEEIRGWLDLAPRAILRLAATQLDPAQRETTYHDEWLPELCYALRGAESRPITRLARGTAYAASLLRSARRVGQIKAAQSRPSQATTEPGSPPHLDVRPERPTPSGLSRNPETHRKLIARIPSVTGRDLVEWFRALDHCPPFSRCEERAHWLADEHGLSQGYASAIVHEYEICQRKRMA